MIVTDELGDEEITSASRNCVLKDSADKSNSMVCFGNLTKILCDCQYVMLVFHYCRNYLVPLRKIFLIIAVVP